jgi:hypothetical protein
LDCATRAGSEASSAKIHSCGLFRGIPVPTTQNYKPHKTGRAMRAQIGTWAPTVGSGNAETAYARITPRLMPFPRFCGFVVCFKGVVWSWDTARFLLGWAAHAHTPISLTATGWPLRKPHSSLRPSQIEDAVSELHPRPSGQVTACERGRTHAACSQRHRC